MKDRQLRPPLEIIVSDVDVGDVQEYSVKGHYLDSAHRSERTLDQANIRSAQDELMRQARARTPTHLARDAAMRVMAGSFAMPLRTAGIDASVAVRFVGPDGREEDVFLDRPRRIDERVDSR